jgi:isoflavone/4'-methoxyisoflavone 2'-hydroxylase
LIAISLLLSSLLLKLFLYPKPKHAAKLPPSPPSLPIIGHFHLLKNSLHRSLSQLSARHGPILYLRLGYRPAVIISSPQLAEECFTMNDVALANRPNFPSVKEVTNNHSTLIFSNYGPLWRNLRKTATIHVLSNYRLLSSTSSRNEEARYLARRLFIGSADDKSAFKKVCLRS